MKALEITAILEEFAPLSLQESWDNSGFLVGDPERVCDSALIGLDCTESLIDEAVILGANLVITHHPLIFRGIKNILYNNVLGRVIEKAIKNDIAIYSIHTNIDKIKEGVSGLMADKIGLKNRVVINEEPLGFGLGIIGDLHQPIPFSQFALFVKDTFNVAGLRYSLPINAPIKRVAVCGGGGDSLIQKALCKGAQILITGDISYHNFFCEDGFMVMDIGHFESEIGVVDLIKRQLLKKIPNFAVIVSTRNYNPIHYLL